MRIESIAMAINEDVGKSSVCARPLGRGTIGVQSLADQRMTKRVAERRLHLFEQSGLTRLTQSRDQLIVGSTRELAQVDQIELAADHGGRVENRSTARRQGCGGGTDGVGDSLRDAQAAPRQL